jgi:L-asparagine transporter-like permease
MPLFPYMQLAGLGLLGALTVTMALDKDWSLSWQVGVPWLALVSLGYWLWKRSTSRLAALEGAG